MLKFDKLKVVTNIDYISDIDKTIFLTQSKGDVVLYYKYHQTSPFSLIIQADVNKDELAIEFTGKILMDDYPNLINHTNIRKCFDTINEMGICRLDVDRILENAKVVKCDVTHDVRLPIQEVTQIKQHLTNFNKWGITKYERIGIAIANKVKTPKFKKRLCIYDKEKELNKVTNKEFLRLLHDKQALLDQLKDKTRFELNIVTMEQIRNLLKIQDNKLYSVLYSDANPILSVFDEAINLNGITINHTNKKDYMMELVIKDCDYDLEKVEAKIRSLTPKTTSIKREMQPFRECYAKMKNANVQKYVRNLLI